jgi:hypothetical protein
MLRVLVAGALLGCLGCRAPATLDPAASADAAPQVSDVAISEIASDDGAACVAQRLELLATRASDGETPTRLYAPIGRPSGDGAATLLFFDTGSALSFVSTTSGPDYVEHAEDVTLGCRLFPLAARRVHVPERRAFGRDVVGYLGADVLLSGGAELDLAGASLTEWPAPPSRSASWPSVRIEEVLGHVLVHARLDGVDVRLLFDTGAPHSLWLGVPGRPEDVESSVQDAEGNAIPVFVGASELELGGLPRTIVVTRAPRWPYFEETVRALGGDVHGIVGLSAFGTRRIVVDRAGARLRISA